MKKLVVILCAALLCGGAYAAVGDLHGAFEEFSATANPNGNWSYHVGAAWIYTTPNPDVPYPYDTLSNTHALAGGTWNPPQGVGAYYSVIGGGPMTGEPNGVSGGLGSHSPFMTRYTVPADVNAVECCLSYLQGYEPSRQMRLHIKYNGVDIASMDSIQPLDNNFPNNGATWTQFFPGQGNKGFKFNVFEGDTIDFVVDPFGTNGNGVGTSSWFASWVREIAVLPEFTLTVNTNPSHISSVSHFGTSTQPINEGVSLVATQYNGCQYGDGSDKRVYAFDSWTGPVADPGAESTTVTSTTAGETITVTANYVIVSACLDVCHPSPIYDFNDDCITNMTDFATFAATWLECNKPECID